MAVNAQKGDKLDATELLFFKEEKLLYCTSDSMSSMKIVTGTSDPEESQKVGSISLCLRQENGCTQQFVRR